MLKSNEWPERWLKYQPLSDLIYKTNGGIEWFEDGTGKRWPRPYLSHSQIDCWERSGESHYEYFRRYLYNEPLPSTPAMQLGSRMAAMLEHREQKTGDPMMDHYRTFLPTYSHREEEVFSQWAGVPLLAKPDGFDMVDYPTGSKKPRIIVGEYKTGKSWTQERADKHEQIDLYDLVFWSLYNIIPENILHWIPTYREGNGQVVPRGDFVDFPTLRTEDQLIKFGGKAMMVWKEIGERYAAECAAIGQ